MPSGKKSDTEIDVIKACNADQGERSPQHRIDQIIDSKRASSLEGKVIASNVFMVEPLNTSD